MEILDILNLLLGAGASLYAICKYVKTGLIKRVLTALVIAVAVMVYLSEK